MSDRVRGSGLSIHPSSGAKARRAGWWACWSAIVLAGLILKFFEPTVYRIGTTLYDDQLFVTMAHGFLQGHWSSSWATTGFATLVKPVGYPLFLAGVHVFPWSPIFSAYLLYMIGVCLIAWGWFRMRGSRAQVTLLLAILTFVPCAFAAESELIYRDFFIMALFTLAVGAAFLLASFLHPPAGDTRHGESGVYSPRGLAGWAPTRWAASYTLAAIAGLVVGVAAITKETWVFVLPAAVAPLFFPFIQRLRPSRFRPWPAFRAGIAGLVFLGGVWVVPALTKHLDQEHYGVAVVDDMSSGAVARTWKLWASVEAGAPEKYVAITRAMRLAVYRVSPAAAKLEPYLENPGDPWKIQDCRSMRICDEAGAWFEWDLMYSSVPADKIHSVHQLQTYFNQIADQIASACDSGQLHCSSSPVLATGLPRLNQIPLSTVEADTGHGLWRMLWEPLPAATPSETIIDVKLAKPYYDLWASVVPGMPSFANLTRPNGHIEVSRIWQVIDRIYRIANLALLAAIALALAGWIVALVRREVKQGDRQKVNRRRGDAEAGLTASMLLISTLIGMGTLALLAAAEDPAYITPLYWADFASIAQLCLIFALFALLPRPQGGHRRSDLLRPQVRVHAPAPRSALATSDHS